MGLDNTAGHRHRRVEAGGLHARKHRMAQCVGTLLPYGSGVQGTVQAQGAAELCRRAHLLQAPQQSLRFDGRHDVGPLRGGLRAFRREHRRLQVVGRRGGLRPARPARRRPVGLQGLPRGSRCQGRAFRRRGQGGAQVAGLHARRMRLLGIHRCRRHVAREHRQRRQVDTQRAQALRRAHLPRLAVLLHMVGAPRQRLRRRQRGAHGARHRAKQHL